MTRSLRLWSTVMAGWYYALVASLIVHPPGKASTVLVRGEKVDVPAHWTFFASSFGVTFWAVTFAVFATLLISLALVRPDLLIVAHSMGLVAAYVFGIGNIVANLLLAQGWLNGALSCVVASAECIIIAAAAELRSAIKQLEKALPDGADHRT